MEPMRVAFRQTGFAGKMWIVILLAAGVAVPVARACSRSYVIWSIRNKPADPLFRFVRNGKAGYIDATGRIRVDPVLPAGGNSFGEFHEGLLAVRDKNGVRYVDRSGRTAFEGNYWLAFDFSEGLAPAATDAAKWGFIDRLGHFVVPPQYWWVDPFSEGLARVSVSGELGSTGYIDNLGNAVVPARLSYGRSFHEGVAAVIIDGPCRITNGGSCNSAEFQPTQAHASYDCRYAFIDKSGTPISELRFDDADDFSEGLAPVRIGRQWGYIDRSGQMSISPRFEAAEPFSEGLAAVSQGGKTGFVDHSGRFEIPPQFESADSFSDGRALVWERGTKGLGTYRFVDKKGRAAFSGTFTAAAPFVYGLAAVAHQGDLKRKGKLAWINTSGKTVFTFDAR
jgi:hypothetical protein